MNPEIKTDQIAEEIARLKRTELELKNRLFQQAMLAQLSQAALSSNSLDSLMQEISLMTARTLGVEYCEILEYLPESKEFWMVAGTGWKIGTIKDFRIPATEKTIAGLAFSTGEPVVVTDLQSDTRFPDITLLAEHKIASGISVVIPGKTRPFGILGAHSRMPRTFTLNDSHFLISIANILGSTIDRFRIIEEINYSHNQLSVVLQGVADGITVQDRTGKVIYANDAAARLIGYDDAQELVDAPPGEIIRKFEIYNEDGQEFPIEQLPNRTAIVEGRAGAATLRFRVRTTGAERWSNLKSTPILNSNGQPELAVSIFQDVTELKRNEQGQRFLAEAGRILANSLDYNQTLTAIAKLAVTNLADWCVVYLVEGEDQLVQRLAVEHVDPDNIKFARELQQRYPDDPNSSTGVYKVIRTGQAEYYPVITDEMLRISARDEEHYQLISKLQLHAAMVLPLQARDRILGAISLFWAEKHYSYTQYDLELAEELARRAAIALDNARLYQETQLANASLEQRVNQRTAQLQSLIAKLRSEISERKKAEEALMENEEMLRSLFDSAPDATILVDEQGKITKANAQIEKLFGYTPDELVGHSIDILLPERLQEHHFSLRQDYFSELRTRTMGAGLQLYGRKKDGSEVPVDVMLSPVKTNQGTQVISAIRDITARKAMESELAELQRRLIDGMEAERLYLAQELHDSAIQELYGITYQLKALESILQNETGAAIESGSPTSYVDSSLESTQVVINLLRSICGELRPPALAPFGLEKAIRAYLEKLAEKQSDLHILMELTSDGQVIPEHQRLALFRIFQHSVNNVIRHAEAKNLTVRWNLTSDQAILEIEDDGKGFELPTRWIKLAREGHLGLVGTLERAQAIGGQLHISTSPGQGTLIQVTVPRTDISK